MIRFRLEMLKRFLLSSKTVIVLICAAGISCILGSLVPQVAEKSPRFFELWKAKSPNIYFVIDLLQLNRVFTSAWFFILVVLITLSLSLSIFYQVKALTKSGRVMRKEITPNSFKEHFLIETERHGAIEHGKQDDKIKELFKGRGYRPYQEGDGISYFVFERNRIGRWGGVIFHAGMLVVIIAALYVLAFQKKGFVQMIQGETFQGRGEEWQAMTLGVLAGNFDPGFRIRLSKFTPVYSENNKIKDLKSSLVLTDDKGGSKELSLSLLSPIKVNGVKIYQSEHHGYSVGLVLEREGEKPVLTHFLLDVHDSPNEPYTGSMDFPGTDYTVEIKFYPDLVQHSPYAVFPGVKLTVTERGDQRFKGKLLLNDRLQIGKDTLTFAQVNYWAGLTLASNYAIPLVYSGFTLSTLGAMVMFMLSYQEIHLKITEEDGRMRLSMGGRSKAYQAIFSEEFREIAEKLKEVLREYGNHPVTQV